MARRRHQCPSCGAALGIPDDHDEFFRCGYCGTVIEDRGRGADPTTGVPRIELHIGHTSMDPEALARYQSGARRVAGVVTVFSVVLLLSIGVVGYVLTASTDDATDGIVAEVRGGEDDSGERPAGPAVEATATELLGISGVATAALLASDDDTAPDVVLVGRGASDLVTGYVDLGADGTLRWSAPTGAEAGTFSPFVATDALVVLSAEDALVAHNRETGDVVWDTVLSDTIQHNICPGCVQVFGDAVVTLTTDGMLRATELASGETRWENRLVATPRQVVSLGGRPAVLDAPQNNDGQLVVFDPASGAEVRRVEVGCPDTTFGGIDPPSVYAPMVPASDGSSVWIVGGTIDPCAQRVDAAGEGVAVTVPLPEGARAPNDHEGVLLDGGHVVLTERGRVTAMDAASGAVVLDVTLEDAGETFPVGVDDGVVVVALRSQRGTPTWSLAGIDLGLGTVGWRFEVEATDVYDETGRPADEAGDWTARLTPDGLAVLQVFGGSPGQVRTPLRIVLQTIPLGSGTASSPVELTVRPTFAGWTRVIGWFGDRVWLVSDAVLAVIDVGDGRVAELAGL